MAIRGCFLHLAARLSYCSTGGGLRGGEGGGGGEAAGTVSRTTRVFARVAAHGAFPAALCV